MRADFFMGAATAAHQVEGNNCHSDCWVLENIPHSMYKERSSDGVDHYHRYEEDLDYLVHEGLNAYRFSMEWARIEPEEGVFDEEALKHYEKVLAACEERGILPIVTLHHFSSPAWVIRKGGWKDEGIVEAFACYCRKIAEYYGEKLVYVCTINEANMGMQIQQMVEKYMGAGQTQEPPASSEGPQVGLNTDNGMEAMYLAMQESAEAFGRPDINQFLDGRNEEQEKIVMNAHREAVRTMKEILPHVKIGLTLSLFDIQALPGGEEEAKRLWHTYFGCYLPYMQEDDFIGVQNYTRKLVGADGEEPAPSEARMTEAGYEFYPQAVGNVVKYIAEDWKKEIIITENGVSTKDDSLRQEFIRTAMEGVRECLAEGINLKGYCHWSLLDNFEWQLGYDQQFGLIEVDRSTMKRKVKPSLHTLGEEYKKLRESLRPADA